MQKALDAGVRKDATNNLRVGLEHPQRPVALGLARDAPTTTKSEDSPDHVGPFVTEPAFEVVYLERASKPRCFDLGVKPTSHDATRNLLMQRGIVPRADPDAPDWNLRRVRRADDSRDHHVISQCLCELW